MQRTQDLEWTSDPFSRFSLSASAGEGAGGRIGPEHASAWAGASTLEHCHRTGAKSDDPFRSKILELNKLLAEVAETPGVTFLDIGERYLLPSGELPQRLMSDFCHPTEEGYAIWAAALKPLLQP